MRCMRRFLSSVTTVVALGVLACSSTVQAATFSLSPNSGDMIRGCSFPVSVVMDAEGGSADAAQIYIDHNLTGGGESISLNPGGLFDSYTVPPSPPAGHVGLVGFGGGPFLGSGYTFANLTLRSSDVGKTVTLDIHFDINDSVTSKIAESGNNILTSVSGGSYTVVDGFCDSQRPNIVNVSPANNAVAYPVDGNLSFTITDNDSGVDISSLIVTVVQDGNTIVYEDDDSRLNYTENNPRNFDIIIDPVDDFTPQLVVDWTVAVSDNAGNTRVQSFAFNDLSCAELGCVGSPIDSQCNDGIDNDNDGLIDLADDGCSDISDNNEYIHIATDCNDFLDNDGDGLVDFDDPGCLSELDGTETSIVTDVVTTTQDIPDCRDRVDNDGDGFIDFPDDPGCDSEDDGSEIDDFSLGAFAIDDLRFYIADRTIQVFPDDARTIQGLVGDPLTVILNIDDIEEPIERAVLNTSDTVSQMFFDNTLGEYIADVQVSETAGLHDAFVLVEFANGTSASIPFAVRLQPYGVVTAAQAGDAPVPAENATVVLEQRINGEYLEIDRQETDATGKFAFLVQNGTYRLRVLAEGFRSQQTASFEVTNHIVNRSVVLRGQIDLLDPEVPVDEKLQFIGETARDQVERVASLADDPVVEERAENAVAPAAAIATVAAVAPALGLLNLLNYFRYLFLQPLLLLGRRKRKGWGQVYDTLTRNPVDLALVRLLDFKTNKVVQSRVTDKEGRYVFFADPGTYRIEVNKNEFRFPSVLLQDVQEDGPFTDIYHGEPITVTADDTAIVANIPLDPVKAEKPPRRIKIEKLLRGLQTWLAQLSIAFGIVAVIISPTLMTIGLLIAQVIMYALFWRLARTPKPKSWGIVYDQFNKKKKLKNTVARLFTKNYDKLVATQLTDAKGRYSFLVGPNDYYITFEHKGYQPARSKDITIKKEGDAVKEDVPMKARGGVQPPQTSKSPAPQTPLQESESAKQPQAQAQQQPTQQDANTNSAPAQKPAQQVSPGGEQPWVEKPTHSTKQPPHTPPIASRDALENPPEPPPADQLPKT